jgi:hypothetical protein
MPGIPSIVQSVMMRYIYFDIFFTEFWIERAMAFLGLELDDVVDDAAMSIQLADNGYNSSQFLKNSGSSLFFVIAYILCYLLFMGYSLLSLYC